ncbi:MAG: restriction endonuclease subunit S [Succinivibrio sp.]|nr:restriction endonuclease subunit S [Succinivibrio sp.]
MKDSGVEWIGKISKNFKLSKVKYELECPMKYGATESGVEFSEELPRYIRITDISANNKLKEENKLSLTWQQAKPYMLVKNSVLFARSGATVGKTFLYKTDYGNMAFAGYLISAIPNETKMYAKWLYYFSISNSYKEWSNLIFTQATIQNISAEKYSNLFIPIPNLGEQNRIINFLDKKCSEIDSLISDKKEQLEKLASYKQSMIYEYVTGKKEVPAQEIA